MEIIRKYRSDMHLPSLDSSDMNNHTRNHIRMKYKTITTLAKLTNNPQTPECNHPKAKHPPNEEAAHETPTTNPLKCITLA